MAELGSGHWEDGASGNSGESRRQWGSGRRRGRGGGDEDDKWRIFPRLPSRGVKIEAAKAAHDNLSSTMEYCGSAWSRLEE